MRLDTLIRRKEVLHYLAANLQTSKWIKKLAKKHGVSAATIRKDVQRQDSWIPIVLLLSDKSHEKYVNHLLVVLDFVMTKAIDIVNRSRSASARVGALKTLLAVTQAQLGIMQSVGRIPKVADKIEGDFLVGERPSDMVKKYLRDRYGQELFAETNEGIHSV